MNISYCKKLSEKHSIYTGEDLIQLQKKGLPETISPSSLILIRRYCNLTPDERTQLEGTGIFNLKSESKSSAVPIHEKVKTILDFCKTGQKLTR